MLERENAASSLKAWGGYVSRLPVREGWSWTVVRRMVPLLLQTVVIPFHGVRGRDARPRGGRAELTAASTAFLRRRFCW